MHKKILKYVAENVSEDSRFEFLSYNRILLLFAQNNIIQFDNRENERIRRYLFNNRIKYLMQIKELIRINTLFNSNDIISIYFKGVVLAELLYSPAYYRKTGGDIDVYVAPNKFTKALTILYNDGYELTVPNGEDNKHHIVLRKDGFIVELHKNFFNPIIGVEESYLRNHYTLLPLGDDYIKTFSRTATLLHLLFHAYMDSYLTSNNLYTLFSKKKFPETNQFLFRAYEIALFSEKYFDEIRWNEIIEDVKHQKLRIIFKKMINDILAIFPEAFPNSFIHTVDNLDYVSDERDQLYKYLVESEVKEKDTDIDCILSNYINDNWEIREGKNVHKKVGTSFNLTKKFIEGKTYQELSCTIDSEKVREGLKLSFKVSNDDFYFSDIDNYDTQGSDGVHLLLCGTEEYSYNSIFFFPKEINGKIKVIVCDVLNNENIVLEDNLIRAEFLKTDKYYSITAILSNEFIEENHLASYFYMGLVVSDCSSETQRRRNQLILSEEDSQWYNPTYFAKIDMK